MHSYRIAALCATLLMSLASLAQSQEKDDGCPFGLSWGIEAQAVKDHGSPMQKTDTDGRFTSFSASSLPKNLSIAEEYSLIFDSAYGLQKIIMASEDIVGDPFGTDGKQKFSNLKQILVSKYGSPKGDMTLELVGLKLYDESDEFYQCLAYSGCGMWIAGFKDNATGMSVFLELRGLSRGKGFLRLTYEGPSWTKALAAHKKDISGSDDDAM